MPFIESKNRRTQMDEIVALMEKHEVKGDGDIHYVLYKYFKYNVERRYNTMKNFLADINEFVAYAREQFLWPYEGDAKKKNGDV